MRHSDSSDSAAIWLKACAGAASELGDIGAVEQLGDILLRIFGAVGATTGAGAATGTGTSTALGLSGPLQPPVQARGDSVV